MEPGSKKTGSGTLVLSNGAGTYTGEVTVNGGTLRATGSGSGSGGNSTLGKNQAGRNITVNAGATLDFAINNVFGGGGMTSAGLPAITVNGGTLNATRFNVVGHVTLNGGTMSQSSTDAGFYEGYEFIGNVTTGGTAASTISSPTSKANHLGQGIDHIFTVADAVAGPAPDLLVNTPFRDGSNDNLGNGILTKAGAGTMQLNAANIYSGLTTVNAGTLEIGGPLGSIGSNAGIVINGATLAVTGSATNRIGDLSPITFGPVAGGKVVLAGNVTESVGPLSLGSDAILDLGAGGVSLWTFAGSATQTWGTNGLSVLNWSGSLLGGGTDQLFFGTDAAGLTAGQAGQVKFYNEANTFLGLGTMLSTGEIVPVPEPSAPLLSLSVLGWLLQRRRRA